MSRGPAAKIERASNMRGDAHVARPCGSACTATGRSDSPLSLDVALASACALLHRGSSRTQPFIEHGTEVGAAGSLQAALEIMRCDPKMIRPHPCQHAQRRCVRGHECFGRSLCPHGSAYTAMALNARIEVVDQLAVLTWQVPHKEPLVIGVTCTKAENHRTAMLQELPASDAL